MTFLATALAPRRAAGPASLLTLCLSLAACSNSEASSDVAPSNVDMSAGTESTDDSEDQDDGDSDESNDSLDLFDEAPACDVWAQDCPSDQKCSWEIIDEVPHPSCVPLAPEPKPAAEACMMFGDPGSGHDDCGLGLMCSWLDDDNAGVCLALCSGSPAEPSCEAAGAPAVCQPCSECPSLCVPTCDPLTNDCGSGYACTPNAGTFTCMPAGNLGDGGLGAPCEYSVQCQAGFGCIDGVDVPGCEGAGCCSPFCSLELPECPEAMVCEPWFVGLDMPPIPDVGVCVLG